MALTRRFGTVSSTFRSEASEGLTVHFAIKHIPSARPILRGPCTLSDMECEFGMTLTNHRLDRKSRRSS